MDDDEKAVVITHFINPYQFWYHKTDEESYIKVRDMEDELTKYFRKNNALIFNPKEVVEGTDLAVRYLPRGKFIRVQVKQIFRNFNTFTFIVWSYDHGFPFETNAQYCRYLPTQFAGKIDRVRCGGIEKIVPSKTEFDFLTQKTVTVASEKWCRRACESFDNFIFNADSVEFVERFNKDGQYWGDLKVLSHHGNSMLASKFLIDEKVAVENVEEFKCMFLTPKRYLACIWTTNDGQKNYKDNKSPENYCGISPKVNLNETDFETAQIKVAAWNDFNRNALRNEGSNKSTFESLDSASTLYDNVDDSVSKVELHSQESSKQHTRRGAKKNQRDPSKKISPKPTKADFGISESEASESGLSVQSRSRYLRLMRLKHMQEKHDASSNISDAEQPPEPIITSNLQVDMPRRPTHAMPETSSSACAQRILQNEEKAESDVNVDKNSKQPIQSGSKSSLDSPINVNDFHETTLNDNLEKFFITRRRPKSKIISHDMNQNSLTEINKCDNEVNFETEHSEPPKRNETEESTCTTITSKSNYLKQLRIQSLNIDKKKALECLTKMKAETSTNTKKSNNAVLLPAGFDLANLNKYNNKDHWHCKETTRKKDQEENQDFRFTRANTDKHKNVENKRVGKVNESENPKHLTKENSLPAPDAVEKTTSHRSKIIQNVKCSDDTDFVDANDDDNEDEDRNSSRSSSITSMYSAKSSLGDDTHAIETDNPKTQMIESSSLQNAKPPNSCNDLLKNFIKTSLKSNDGQNHATPPNVSQHVANETAQTLPTLTGDNRLRSNYFNHTVLAHGTIELTPIESLNKIPLASDVRDAMVSLGFSRVSRTQSYAWPHLLQGNSLFVVNPPDSCKTWSYIPALCTAVIDCFENEFAPNVNGPLAIVLVASSDRAITVWNYCSRLLRKLERPDAKIISSFGVRELIQTQVALMEGCAILVATPSNFRRLLEENRNRDLFINSKRLRHIILDDVDVMLSRNKDDFTSVLKTLHLLAPKDENTKTFLPQLVVTSRFYWPIFEKLMPKSKNPLLVIGDFLEAAVYGKAKICFEICAKTKKIEKIIEFMNEHPYKKESLIILCNSDEDLFALCDQLEMSRIDFLGCHSESTPLVRQQVLKWKLQTHKPSKVLVCTDSVLNEFEIQYVQNLIHYSLARMWTQMKHRFSVHKEMYPNLVKQNFNTNKSNNIVATSLILLDEENNEELPRIIEFLKSHNQLKHINPEVVKLSKSICIQREKERCKADNQFCDLFFEYGDCDKVICQKRHTLTEDDVRTGEGEEPLIQSGDLRMLVLNVYSPTHYAVRLLEHRSNSTADWACIRQSDKAAAFALKLNFFYANSENLSRLWPVKLNDICVLERNGSYRRARVLEVPTLKSENIVKSLDVTLKLIDDGDILTEKSDYLYTCHEQFKSFPAQSSNVRLIGLRPLDNEACWDGQTTHYVKGTLKHKLKKNESVCASVSFSLVNTIVVRNLFVMKKLNTLGNYIVSTNLKRDLVNNNYAVLDENAEQRIRDVIKDYGYDSILNNVPATEGDTEIVTDGQSESEDRSCLIDESVEMEKTNEEKPIETKKNESESCSTNDNVADTQKSIDSKPRKSRSEFIRQFQISKLDQTAELENNVQLEKPEEALPKACSFLEFLLAVQRSNEIDAEDYDLEAEGMEEVRKYIQDTDKYCKLEIMREMERQNIKIPAILAAAPKLENLEDLNNKTDLMPYNAPQSVLVEVEPLPVEKKATQTSAMKLLPPLQNLHKRPQTTWYETNHLIILSVSAANIDDYYLEVEKTFLYFMATVDGVEQVLVLNFMGTIEPQHTSHEIRGLNVIVRLVKSLFMRWPRLVKQEEKMPWLSYNLNMLNVEEEEKLLPQQFIERVFHHQPRNLQDYEDMDESDNELETYPSIINNDDIQDPINSERF